MKYLLLSCLFFGITSLSFAQSKCINTFIDKYQGLENVTNINISGNILDLITSAKDEQGARKFISKLNRLRVLTIPQQGMLDGNDLMVLKQGIQASNYEELIQIRDGKDFVRIYLQENKDQVIEELLVLVEDEEDFTLVSLSGQMYYQDLQSLELDGEAGEALKKLPTDHRMPRP
jgi:hypothetical protein